LSSFEFSILGLSLEELSPLLPLIILFINRRGEMLFMRLIIEFFSAAGPLDGGSITELDRDLDPGTGVTMSPLFFASAACAAV
jgi:hypothetical protein